MSSRVLIVVLLLVLVAGAWLGSQAHMDCKAAVNAGLYAGALDQQLDEVFYYCNTTDGRKDGRCTPELLIELAAQSLQNHEAFIKAASKCVPITFTEKGDGKENKHHF